MSTIGVRGSDSAAYSALTRATNARRHLEAFERRRTLHFLLAELRWARATRQPWYVAILEDRRRRGVSAS